MLFSFSGSVTKASTPLANTCMATGIWDIRSWSEVSKLTPSESKNVLDWWVVKLKKLWAFPDLFLDFFTIDNFHNGKWWQETGKKSLEYATFYYTLLEKAWHPMRIDWQQFWTGKSLSPTWDSYPACLDRIPLLYHLCHHHFLVSCKVRLCKNKRSSSFGSLE